MIVPSTHTGLWLPLTASRLISVPFSSRQVQTSPGTFVQLFELANSRQQLSISKQVKYLTGTIFL